MDIQVYDIIKKPNAILHTDGIKLYEKMAESGVSKISLSFRNIGICTTSFLNASIGKFIYERGNPKLISISDLSNNPTVKGKIRRVILNAIDQKKRTSQDKILRGYQLNS